jgi:hypothetical protein
MVLFFARVTRGAAAVILYALGVMSLLWMAVVASLNFAQKVLPRGDRLTLPSALAFVALGIWIAAPTAPPGWSDPTRRPRRPR